MSLEMALWRTDGTNLTRLRPTSLHLESDLEQYVMSDPDILGQSLLIIGQQVTTAFGGIIDLLALDETGAAHVIELKRDKTPRDVTAQTLDYGSWVATLGRTEIEQIFDRFRPGVALEAAFDERFNQPLPEEVNASQVMTIVSASLDAATERIVRYLAERFEVPINAVFFKHFVDGGTSYLARTWLVSPEIQADNAATGSRGSRTREHWNEKDWYVSFGEFDGGRNWDDARKYGFVSAGGDVWYSRTLRKLPVGARVFVHIPKSGYVGVGTVTGEPSRIDELEVEVDGTAQLLSQLPLQGNYRHGSDESDDNAEWAVPVTWDVTVPAEQAFWTAGLYANQNSATKLRQQFTIETVSRRFNLDQ